MVPHKGTQKNRIRLPAGIGRRAPARTFISTDKLAILMNVKFKRMAVVLALAMCSTVLAAEGTVTITYFYSPGCEPCEEFLAVEVPRLEEKTGLAITIDKKDLLNRQDFETFQRIALELDVEVTKFPVVVIGTTLLQGEKEITSRLPRLVRSTGEAGQAAGQGATVGSTDSAGGGRAVELRLIPVVLAGLLDGVNPCAFTTLIFLIAALTVAGRGRREILIIGLFFSLAVFVTYLLIGVGLLEALRLASTVTVISTIFDWVLICLLMIFAGISLYDWILIRRGREREIVLQLPKAMKRRIHASVRTRTKSTLLIGSSLAMGFFVSVFELACTGQIYFPTIAYLVKTDGGARNYLFLVLYNVGFIVPLLAVFALTYTGVSSKRITVFFRRRMGVVKLATAMLFAGLAALTFFVQ
jgi:cytochrome c biogenesis protein CcdA